MCQSSHRAIAHRRCIVCTSEYEIAITSTGEHQTVGWGLCPEHRALHSDGLVALIECDIAKSGCPMPGDRLNPDKVHRTGLVAFLDRGALCSIFNIRVDPSLAAVYVECGAIAKLLGRCRGRISRG